MEKGSFILYYEEEVLTNIPFDKVEGIHLPNLSELCKVELVLLASKNRKKVRIIQNRFF